MDPLSALSIAGNVLQFLDFGFKLISKAHSLSKSVDGRLVEHLHFRTAADTLTEQCRLLSAHVDPKKVKRDAVPGQDGLADVVRRSLLLAQELQQAVDDLRVNGVGKKFKSFRNALKSILSKDRLELMLKHLQHLRAELMMSLLILLREESSADTQKLLQASKTSEYNILIAIQQITAAHKSDIADLHRAIASGWFLHGDDQSKAKAAHKWLDKNSAIVSDFTDSINETTSKATNHAIQRKIRDSLCFYEIFQRYHEIPEAEARTFGWIYDVDSQMRSAWSNFGQWLQGNGADSAKLYWVSGKPGSGKSTLLRYLCSNVQTKAHLKRWADPSEVLLASCFFWNPGTALQKSQQGLLRTLLFQLLVEQPDFPKHLFPKRWQMLELGSEFAYEWSNEELLSAILAFVEYFSKDFKIVIFVDGLDEYEGTEDQRQTICDILHKLARYEAVKICVSSRPWNIYADAFRKDPKLRLEDLTKRDILNFVQDRLANNEQFQQLALREHQEAEELQNAIVEKAQGVFLWVRLVTNNLLKSLRANDDAYDLTRRLAEIPTELGSYFQKMFDNLDNFYLEDAARMFDLSVLGSEPLMTYYYTHPSSIEKYLSGIAPVLQYKDMLELQDIEDRRINARCMGLLESFKNETAESSKYDLRLVDFLHRTAREFIFSPTIQEKICAWRKGPFDLNSVLLPSWACQLSSCNPAQPWMSEEDYLFMLQRAMVVLAESKDLTMQMHGIVKAVKAAFEAFLLPLQSKTITRHESTTYIATHGVETGAVQTWRSSHRSNHTDFLAWAMLYGFESYVLQELRNATSLPTIRKMGQPYLLYAVCFDREIAITSSYLSSDNCLDSAVRITERLFELGADPNEVFDGSTVWGHCLDYLLEDLEYRNTVTAMPQWAFTMMKLFIEHSAIDTVRIGTGKHGAGVKAGTRYSKFIRTANPWKVADKIFPPKQAKEMHRILDKSAHGTLAAKSNRLIAALN